MTSADELALVVVGLFSLLLAAIVWLVLPIVSWVRTSRLKRELMEVRARLAALEAARHTGHVPAAALSDVVAPAVPAATPAAPVEAPVPFPATPPIEPPIEAAPAVAGPAVPLPASDSTSLEDAIGGRLMLWVGAVVLVLGVAFFLKYAFDNEWITETMRVALGVAAGLALIATGQGFATRGYRTYGQIVTGGGLAVLFLAIYAAFSFYALIGQTPAFVSLVLVTAGAAVLADRQRAMGLALMAVGGGFATPFLVGSGTDAQLTLFSYDALLVVGTLYLANRQNWPRLNALSYVFTVLTIGAWMSEYWTPSKWLRTELFLTLFCVLFGLILRAQLARRGWKSLSSLVLATGPVLYHVASLAVLEPHGVAVWVYLIAAAMVTVSLAVRADSVGWRLAAWVAIVLPLIGWVDAHQSSRWLTANLVSVVAIFTLHAIAQLDRIFRQQRTLTAVDHILQHANGYALVGLLYASVEDVWLAIAPTLSLVVMAVHGAIAWMTWSPDRRAALHALAVAVGALTVALAIELDGPWLTVAIGVEGALVVWLGLALGERGFRLGGAALLAAAIVRYFIVTLPATPTVFHPIASEPFAMGLALAALLYALAWVYRRREGELAGRLRSATTACVVAASVLVVVACSAHNDLYWQQKGYVSADARFASSLALSAIWTILASIFIGVGMLRAFPPLRFLAMALFGLTVLKVFLVDLSSLGGIYRILGFIGVGLVLLAVSFLYQRGRRGAATATEPPRD